MSVRPSAQIDAHERSVGGIGVTTLSQSGNAGGVRAKRLHGWSAGFWRVERPRDVRGLQIVWKVGVMQENTSKRNPPELKERAVRMVAEVRADYESEWSTMRQVPRLSGVTTQEMVHKWFVRRMSSRARGRGRRARSQPSCAGSGVRWPTCGGRTRPCGPAV